MTDIISSTEDNLRDIRRGGDERERLAALRRYGITAPAPAPDLGAIVRLARLITGAEIAQVNLIDLHHQETLAAVGTGLDEIDRSDALCDRVVRAEERVHTVDASRDERFAGSSFVSSAPPMVRLYAGAPLWTPDGHVIGSLCVADRVPGRLAEAQLTALEDLASQVMMIFEFRHQSAQLLQTLGQLDHELSHDELTGLPNRRQFLAALDAIAVERDAFAGDSPDDLVVIGDLDGFKAVNDAHGHATGDQVLRVVAERLRGCCRPTDLVARVGGDEFAIIVRNLRDADVDAFLLRLDVVVSRPITVGQVLTSVGFSAGAARLGTEFDHDIVDLADERMYAAKRGQLAHFEDLPAASARSRTNRSTQDGQTIASGQ